MADPDEPLDHDRAISALNDALRVQYRSSLAYSLVAGSLTGFAHVALGPQLYAYASAELDDARRLVEKIVALGAESTTRVADLQFHAKADDAFAWLLEAEHEAIDAVAAVIQAGGGDAESEALEHRLEHIIMRKQEQVEALERARRG
ncbi:MAG: ferritin-like domain-containing protein [Solirubrobacteraceae bacterium]